MTVEQRTDRFKALRTHAWYHKLSSKLCDSEQRFCMEFIQDFGDFDEGKWEHSINRMFLATDTKPKHWTEMMELLLVTNQPIRQI